MMLLNIKNGTFWRNLTCFLFNKWRNEIFAEKTS